MVKGTRLTIALTVWSGKIGGRFAGNPMPRYLLFFACLILFGLMRPATAAEPGSADASGDLIKYACRGTTLPGEKLAEIFQKIATHGDLADKAHIEKTLQVDLHYIKRTDNGTYYLSDPIPGTNLLVNLSIFSETGRKAVKLSAALKMYSTSMGATYFSDCLHLTPELLAKYLKGASPAPRPDSMPTEKGHIYSFSKLVAENKKKKTVTRAGYMYLDDTMNIGYLQIFDSLRSTESVDDIIDPRAAHIHEYNATRNKQPPP